MLNPLNAGAVAYDRMKLAIRLRVYRWLLGYCTTNRYQNIFVEIRRVKPANILEIGTWNGENARRMISTAATARGGAYGVRYWGFDLFDQASPALIAKEVGLQPPSRLAVEKKLSGLVSRGAEVHLIQGDTKDTLPGLIPGCRKWIWFSSTAATRSRRLEATGPKYSGSFTVGR